MLVALIFASASFAADLRWEDLSPVIEEHPALREAQARVEQARGDLCAARTPPNPELELSAGKEGAGLGEPRWEAAASLDLGWLPGLAARSAGARAAVAEAEAEARSVWLDLGGELRGLFWGLVHDAALARSLERSATGAAELLALTRRRVAAGEVRPAEAARAEVELARARTALAGVLGEQRARREALRRLVPGLDGDFQAMGELCALPVLPSLDEALDRLRVGDPRVEAARARAEGAAAARREARSSLVPAFSAGVFAGEEGGLPLRGATLGAELPIWDWDQGGLRAAAAGQRADSAGLEAAVLAVEAEGIAAWTACDTEKARAQAFDGEVVAPTRSALAALEAGYGAGEIALLDLIDARRVLADAEGEALDAWLAARLACGDLAARLGEEP